MLAPTEPEGLLRAVALLPPLLPPDAAVGALVERFDRRGTEPFELFRAEWGHNSVRINEISLEFV